MFKRNFRRSLQFFVIRRKGFSYKKKERLSFLIFLVLFLIIFILIFNGISNRLMPTIVALSDAKVKYLATGIATDVVNQKLCNLKYDDLIFLQKDANDKVTALQANVVEMNKISAEISSEMQARMVRQNSLYVQVPLGNIFGNGFISNRGPNITIKIIPYGNIDVDFKTEFISAGINQTRHKIYLEIRSKMLVIVPLVKKGSEVVTKVPVAETVIVGDVPESFINIDRQK